MVAAGCGIPPAPRGLPHDDPGAELHDTLTVRRRRFQSCRLWSSCVRSSGGVWRDPRLCADGDGTGFSCGVRLICGGSSPWGTAHYLHG
jgi:hypothetical protein